MMKLARGVISICSALFAALALLTLALVLCGFRPFVLQTASMEPLYKRGSLCWINTRATLDSVAVGDVLAYRSSSNTLVLHRVVDKAHNTSTPNAVTVVMQGDANSLSQRVELSRVNFVGKEAFCVPSLGAMVQQIMKVGWFLVICFVLLACITFLPLERLRSSTPQPSIPRPLGGD